jgi:predicted ATPase
MQMPAKRKPLSGGVRKASSGGFVTSVRIDAAVDERPGDYPFDIPSIRNLTRLSLNPGITFFVGENGSGKSTLLEAIAVRLAMNAEGGSRNHRFSTVNTHSGLHESLVVERPRHFSDCYFLRAESFYNVATYNDEIGLMDPEGRSLHARSHGEAFMALFTNRLLGHGLYLFDEPEAALSPQRQLALIPLLHRLVHHDSQLIIATHSPILMAYPGATIYEFAADGIREIAYEDTEHYIITRDFLNAHQRMISLLIADEDENLRSMQR